MRRVLSIWLVLLAAYGAALAIHGTDVSPAEQHRLIVADAIVHEHALNTDAAYRRHPGVRPAGRVVSGRRLEPAGVGTPLLIAPAYAIGGRTAVELFCAALLALAFALGTVAARAIVPEPWATRATLALALSPPALAASSTVAPEPAAALLVTAAALTAMRAREQPRIGTALSAGTLLAPVIWLSVRATLAGGAVALSLIRWLRRRNRGLAAFVAFEGVLTSLVVYLSLNDRLYDGLTPASVRLDGGTPIFDAGRIVHAPAVAGQLLLRAPVVALAGVGVWLLWRSARDRLVVIAADQADVEVGAGLAVAVLLAAFVAATFGHPHLSHVTAPDLVVALPLAAGLIAWGWRFAPRTALALAALTLAEAVVYVVT